jgi:hypothetical protein
MLVAPAAGCSLMMRTAPPGSSNRGKAPGRACQAKASAGETGSVVVNSTCGMTAA